MLKFVAFVFFFGGAFFAFRGFAIEIKAVDVMQQIYSAIWLVGGLLMIIGASVCGGIADLSDAVKRMGQGQRSEASLEEAKRRNLGGGGL